MNRTPFDEAVTAMTIHSSPYAKDYIFYLYLLSKCNVVFKNDLKAPAAVNFEYDHYNLFINLSDYIGTSKKDEEPRLGFGKLPLAHRIGIIKHEMLHIVYSFNVRRKELQASYPGTYDADLANVAEDCALNQDINREHLPRYAIYPDTLQQYLGIPVKVGESTEYYYKLLMDNTDKTQKLSKLSTLDSHDIPSIGDTDIQQIITKSMIETAAESTLKAQGTLPEKYASWVDMFTAKAQLDWKKLLNKVLGNKRVNTKTSIYKPNRRNPNAMYLKGKIKDRLFDLLVVADVSGSVSDKELLYGLNEIRQICKNTSSSVKLIQIDTHPYEPEDIKVNASSFKRKAHGGTILYPALQKAKECKIRYDAVVVITDGYISEEDKTKFMQTNKKIIWVLTDNVNPNTFTMGKMVGCPICINGR